jgi:DNA-binding SARP family transcriptional activator
MEKTGGVGSEAAPPSRWSLLLFGGFRLSTISGESVTLPGKRERILLAYLLLSPNCRQPRRKLADLLWGDTPDEAGLHNLRTCVWGLRNALSDPERRLLISEGEEIALDASMFDVDAWTFRRLAMEPERQALETAAALYTGAFLDGLSIDSEEFESWRRAEAIHYRDQAIDVLTRLMAKLSDAGEAERAIQTGQRLSSLDPMHEVAVRQMMRLYAQIGRRAAAVQLYQSLADTLRSELGAEPEPETRRAFVELSRSYPEPTPVGSPANLEPQRPSRATNPPAPASSNDRPKRTARSSGVFASRRRLVFSAAALMALVGFLSYRQLAFLLPTLVNQTSFASEIAAAVDPIAMSPHLSGTSGNDMIFGLNDEDHEIRGLDGDDVIYGANGNDWLYGNNGNDILFGENGDDILTGNAGSDWLFGGAGGDTANYFTNNVRSSRTVDLRILGPQLVGLGARMTEEWDTLTSIENVNGSKWDDTLTGDAGDNVLTGNAGGDILTGGAGNDTFVYRDASHGTGDRITDFGHGKDTIDLSAIDSGDGGAGDFNWSATTATVNGVWHEERGGNTVVQADVNGDTTADFQITLVGTELRLRAANFRLLRR